ncbi:TetR/AcrR family transcriptional regulator [Haloactinomyces albus]|uniref:AcrR family transcriptional regulator n=1 Tax=Haloactinomyces albus TaxID=1352928 RepID=A0AAE3ZBP1_9ACTN|nr:TetR/AcrR family transcriptional regulator [Haloactinomyces albus]MDR7301968.1 AcrR family transcriptional regulator [Haloactinomyces albus]
MRPAPGPCNARSRRTRAALLAATQSLLDEVGVEATTMSAIAERANVTRRTTYLHFHSRAELITTLFDQMRVAEGGPPAVHAVWQAPDATTALAEWTRRMAHYHSRLIALIRAMEQVRSLGTDAAHDADSVAAPQRIACDRLALRLDDEDVLAPPWTVQNTADFLWSLASARLFEALTIDRGWSRDRYAQLLSALLRSAFVSGETTPAPSPEHVSRIRDAPDAGQGRRTATEPPPGHRGTDEGKP